MTDRWRAAVRISLFGQSAGLAVVEVGTTWTLHIGVRPGHWLWGHAWEEYDHSLEYWAVGPLFLLVKGRACQ